MKAEAPRVRVRSELNSITFRELLDYNAAEARKWRAWLEKQPASVLDLPIQIYGKTARDLLLHIFAVELRYAQRLAGQAVSAYEDLPKNSLDDIFSVGERAQEMLTNFLDSASDKGLNSTITFPTISAGELTA
ncbi:MAG: DinB family protein, partial [Acidobacteria bacterium]|nr:DinB family protein [Acidobacteriota bacterium]